MRTAAAAADTAWRSLAAEGGWSQVSLLARQATDERPPALYDTSGRVRSRCRPIVSWEANDANDDCAHPPGRPGPLPGAGPGPGEGQSQSREHQDGLRKDEGGR